VSIGVPLHRPNPEHLARLVESLAQQQLAGLEVVMVDDATPGLDAAALDALLGPLAARADAADITLTWTRNDTNLGMVANWNRAVRSGSADLAMCVSQDDELGPGMLAAYVAELTDPSVAIVSSAEEFIDDGGRAFPRRLRVGHRHHVFVDRDRYVLDRTELVRLSLRNGQSFGEPSAVMFRRAVFDAIGGYDASFEHAADVDFNLRAAAYGRAVYLRHPYLRRRWHARSQTRVNVASGAVSRDRLRLYERYCDASGLTERDRAEARVSLASHSVYDAVRAARAGQWPVVRGALENLRVGLRAPVGVHAAHVTEIVTRRNRDRR
jgi:GT2 family glycosyltransferase